MFRLSADPNRWMSVTAPVLAPEATVNPVFLMRYVEIARYTTPRTWLKICGWAANRNRRA